MNKNNWGTKQEEKHRKAVKAFFGKKIKKSLKGAKQPIKVGNSLGDILKKSDKDVVKMITPRAVTKWASHKTLPKWNKIIKDPKMVLELREIGKSIANSMRPLAGNNFAIWVARILNEFFIKENLPLKAITSGKIKKELNKRFTKKLKGNKGSRDYKPDIDIIIVRKDCGDKPVAILSAKTTLAERVMQTINWHRYLKSFPKEYKQIKLFLVTAWDTFKSGANKERVQELDGVYVCNKDVNEYGNIKRFDKIGKDLKKLC